MKTKILIILGDCDNKNTVNNYCESIKSHFKGFPMCDINTKDIVSVEEFQKEIDILCKDYSNGDRIYIDIQCHGNSYGLSFSNSEFCEWQKLYEQCKKVKDGVGEKGEFCLILSSCFSFGFADFLCNNKYNDACNHLLCTSNTIKGLFITDTAEKIFRNLAYGYDIVMAVDKAKKECYDNYDNNQCPEINLYELFIYDNPQINQSCNN